MYKQFNSTEGMLQGKNMTFFLYKWVNIKDY